MLTNHFVVNKQEYNITSLGQLMSNACAKRGRNSDAWGLVHGKGRWQAVNLVSSGSIQIDVFKYIYFSKEPT